MPIWLKLRMYLLTIILFGIIYALISVAASLAGIKGFLFYGVLAIGITFVQYLIGPKIVEWSMKVKYVSEKEEPELHKLISELAKEAKIPKPKIGIAQIPIPNAFAFGRWASDGRVCVTEWILKLLDKKELRAVLGHEISHLKNKDVAIITLLSVIPMICWFVAHSFLWSRDEKGNAALIGLFAFILYFVTNLLVLYGSRIREYYADRSAVGLGNKPNSLASALFKLVQGSSRLSPQALKQAEGMKAFFANDVSRAHLEIRELVHLDLDGSGHIDEHELAEFGKKEVKLRTVDKLMELMSTHPNMLKRIKVLSEMK